MHALRYGLNYSLFGTRLSLAPVNHHHPAGHRKSKHAITTSMFLRYSLTHLLLTQVFEHRFSRL